jgi:hypothetical protein
MTRETVLNETPASFATSLIVGISKPVFHRERYSAPTRF